jgi:hypothetical protein
MPIRDENKWELMKPIPPNEARPTNRSSVSARRRIFINNNSENHLSNTQIIQPPSQTPLSKKIIKKKLEYDLEFDDFEIERNLMSNYILFFSYSLL